MGAPDAVAEVVARLDRNLEAYRSGHYKEAQLRNEFIDPFFIALGWDVDDEPVDMPVRQARGRWAVHPASSKGARHGRGAVPVRG